MKTIKEQDERYLPGVSEVDDDMTDAEWIEAYGQPEPLGTFASKQDSETRYAATPSWDPESPTTQCFHMGNGLWRTRCRGEGCTVYRDSYGAVPRYATIGMHEYREHGLDVPGISVGLMQTS